jgi:hypothetical protein
VEKTLKIEPAIKIPKGFKRKRPVPKRLRDHRDRMFDLIKGRCSVAVEIGSEFGWWAHRFLTQVPESALYCIDPWPTPPNKGPNVSWKRHTNGDDNYREWQLNMEPWLGKRVFPVRGDSYELGKTWDIPIDFLFIDGDHSTLGVLGDLQMWVPKVKPGGLVVGHDWDGRHGERIQRGVLSYWDRNEFSTETLYFSGAVHSRCYFKRIGEWKPKDRVADQKREKREKEREAEIQAMLEQRLKGRK